MEENDASCGAWEWLNYKEALILEAKYPLLFCVCVCVCVCVVFLQICFDEIMHYIDRSIVECPIVDGD